MRAIERGIFTAKLYHFQDILKKQNIESDLVEMLDATPCLWIYLPHCDVQLQYMPDETEERMENFVMMFETEIEHPQSGRAEKELLCNLFNQGTLGGFAFVPDDAEKIEYRMFLSETYLPIADANFLRMVELYSSYYDKLREAITNSL